MRESNAIPDRNIVLLLKMSHISQTDTELCAVLNPHLSTFLKTLAHAMSPFLLREDGHSPTFKITHFVIKHTPAAKLQISNQFNKLQKSLFRKQIIWNYQF